MSFRPDSRCRQDQRYWLGIKDPDLRQQTRNLSAAKQGSPSQLLTDPHCLLPAWESAAVADPGPDLC